MAGLVSPAPAWHGRTPTAPSSSCTPRTGARWSGSAVLLVRDVGTAEEVVQDAFVALHGRWGSLRDPDRALAYLRQAVVNRSRSALRHRQGRPARPRGAAAGAGRRPRRRRAPRWTPTGATAVLDALAALPRRQREVLALRYYLDLSEAEIAETLGISRGAVKSHASRGAAALRESLRHHLGDHLSHLEA